MEEVLALIEEIIEEHKVIAQRVQILEQVANDVSALLKLESAEEDFMPGRFDQRQNLQKLEESLKMIDKGLRAHFGREEAALLTAFERHGGKGLVSALRCLLSEHDDLRKRFVHSKKHLAELTSGGLSRYVWEASAYDMRAHLSHTRKLLEAHLKGEHKLLLSLRRQLIRAQSKNG